MSPALKKTVNFQPEQKACHAFLNSYKQELDSYCIFLHIAQLVIPMAINIFLSNIFIQTSLKWMGSTPHRGAEGAFEGPGNGQLPISRFLLVDQLGQWLIMVNSHIVTLVSWSNYVNWRTAVTAAQAAFGKEAA